MVHSFLAVFLPALVFVPQFLNLDFEHLSPRRHEVEDSGGTSRVAPSCLSSLKGCWASPTQPQGQSWEAPCFPDPITES